MPPGMKRFTKGINAFGSPVAGTALGRCESLFTMLADEFLPIDQHLHSAPRLPSSSAFR